MRVLSLLSVVGVLAALAAPCLGQSSSSSTAAGMMYSSSSSSAAMAASSSAMSSSAMSSSARPSSSSTGTAAQATGSAQAGVLAGLADATGVNYALTIERLDSTFWSCYLNTYTVSNQPYCAYVTLPAGAPYAQSDFAAAGFNATVWQAVNLIAAEELAHAALLNLTVMNLGYSPVQPCQYQYPSVNSVMTYLQQGLQFETVGTAAYAGALNGLTSPTLVQAAASIASVEARHAGYLSALLGQTPFSTTGFNAAYNSSYVASLIAPFYVNPSCLAQTMLPAVRPFGITAFSGAASTFNGTYVNPYGVTYTAAQRTNDLETLNYALVLEDLESNFYNQASTAFNASSFTNAGYGTSVPTYLSIIAQNENTHVAVLSQIISAYGGVPVQNCTYNFSALGFSAFSSVNNYLQYASALEAVGVMAYDGAANTLTDTYLLQAAATIDMIEARHVAFINSLLYPTNASQAFPTATDTPMTPTAVYTMIANLGIISCAGQNIAFPSPVNPLPIGSGGSNPYPSSSSSSTGYYNGAAVTAPAQWLMVVAAVGAIIAMLL